MSHLSLPIVRQWMFNGLSVLSLVLCLSTVGLWVRSSRCDDRITWYGPHGRGYVACTSGRVGLVLDPSAASLNDWHFHFSLPESGDVQAWLPSDFIGFGWSRYPGDDDRGFAIPHWFLALLFALLPMFHLRAILRARRRARAGLCPRCGYDLRATPDRCPECGMLATESQRAQRQTSAI